MAVTPYCGTYSTSTQHGSKGLNYGNLAIKILKFFFLNLILNEHMDISKYTSSPLATESNFTVRQPSKKVKSALWKIGALTTGSFISSIIGFNCDTYNFSYYVHDEAHQMKTTLLP